MEPGIGWLMVLLINHGSADYSLGLSPAATTYLELLEQELASLSSACSSLTSAEARAQAGTADMLGRKDSDALEELLLSAKTGLCSARDKTATARDKLVRLQAVPLYSKCMVDRQCRAMMPALDGIEEHFEARRVKLQLAKESVGDLEKILPPASQFLANAFSETLEDLWHVINMFQTVQETPTGEMPLPIVVMAIWLSLLVMVISTRRPILLPVFLLLLLFLAISYYLPSTLKYKLLYREMTGVVRQVQEIKIIERVWDIEEFQTVAVYKDLDRIKEIAHEAMDNLKAGFPEHENHLKLLQKMGYSDLANLSRITYEKFHKYASSLAEVLTKAKYFFSYVKNTFETVLEMKNVKLMDLKRFIKTILEESMEIEREYDAHRNVFIQFIGDFNELSQEAEKLEKKNNSTLENIRLIAQLATIGGIGVATLANPLSLGFTVAGRIEIYHISNLILQDSPPQALVLPPLPWSRRTKLTRQAAGR